MQKRPGFSPGLTVVPDFCFLELVYEPPIAFFKAEFEACAEHGTLRCHLPDNGDFCVSNMTAGIAVPHRRLVLLRLTQASVMDNTQIASFSYCRV